MKQKQTHRDRKQTYGYQRGEGWGGINWEFGINICIPIYIKQINNKNLLQSTKRYSQHFVIRYNGKESEKVHMCVCVYMYICHTQNAG